MADLKGKVYKFFNRIVEVIDDKSKKEWIFYGYDNLFPNKLLRYINESGTAKMCTDKVAEYTEADGFLNDVTFKYQFNKEQKGDDFLTDIAQQVAIFGGFALLVKRNLFNEVKEAEVLSLDKIRKDKNDVKKLWYNKNVGNTQYKDNEWKPYPAFNPNAKNVFAEYPQGEIAYFYKKSADNPHYPVPSYYAGIEDVISSAEISKMDLELALNGFMPSSLITFIGNPNQEIPDSHGKTVDDYYDEVLESFTGGIKDRDGLSDRFSLLKFWASTKDEVPVLQSFDAKGVLDASNAKRDLINREVCRLFKVPPVLVGFSEATILGNQLALANAQKVLIDTVNPMQRFITDSLKTVFPAMDFTISQKTPLAVADPALLDVLTAQEKRRIFWGLEPLTENTTQNVN
jgi:predicted RNA-binding protein with PIN domain